MSGFRGRAAWALALVSLLGVTSANASTRSRPDLVVTKGSVRASGGRLSGSFIVRNTGWAARASSASIVAQVAGRRQPLSRFVVRALRRSASRTVTVTGAVPVGLPVGSWALLACADARAQVRERSEANNCRVVGKLTTTATPGPPIPDPPLVPDPAPVPTPAPVPSIPPVAATSVPTDPVPFTKNTGFKLTDYWIYVPTAYDSSHATPMTLFVWLHGCGGQSQFDIYTVAPGGAQNYIALAPGGREGACWNVNTDAAKLLAAIADLKTHFNINPKRVVLGGYSSGGDLAYRTAFYNANTFAGLLIENSSPFRDTGSTQAASLAASSWKFPVVQLAHLQDATYPIAGVRTETDALQDAGFPMTRIEQDGTHYDAAGAMANGHPVPGTAADLASYLLPYLAGDWLSPPAAATP